MPQSEPSTDWVLTRWWRVVDGKGRVWAETSDRKEAEEKLETAPGGGTLQRLYSRTDFQWMDAD